MDCRFQGIRLAFANHASPAVLSNCRSVNEDREVAASELGRLASLGNIHGYEGGSYPPELCGCPSHLIVGGDKVRVAHDWPDYQYSLSVALANPPAEYGAMVGCL